MITRELITGDKTQIELTFSQLMEQYKWSLEASNRSCVTVSWYLDILNRFAYFLDRSNSSKPISQIGRTELRDYVNYLQNTTRWEKCTRIKKDKGKLSAYSIQGHVRGIKAFFGWLKFEGFINSNPLEKYPLPKVPQMMVKTLSMEQIARLSQELDKLTPIGSKYYLILLLLLDTGMRISELVNIKTDDIDLTNCLVKVLGKGRKERIIPFCRETQKELFRHIKLFRPKLSTQESIWLFPRMDGNHISINSVQQFLGRLADKAGLGEIRCSPHIFRHTFATQSIANEANVFALKDIMGHSSLQTTLKYTHLQTSDLRAQHARFSPVTNFLKDKHRIK